MAPVPLIRPVASQLRPLIGWRVAGDYDGLTHIICPTCPPNTETYDHLVRQGHPLTDLIDHALTHKCPHGRPSIVTSPETERLARLVRAIVEIACFIEDTPADSMAHKHAVWARGNLGKASQALAEKR